MLLCLVAVPWVIARLPEDYFCANHRRRGAPSTGRRWLLLPLVLLKNLLGLVLLLLGLLMLVTPGQGLLTVLAGLLLLNFPGKYRLERQLVAQPAVFRGLNWLRGRLGRRPFQPPFGEGGAQSPPQDV